METSYLLDTNIFIYIRQRKSEALIERFEKLRAGEAAISIITYGELIYGAEKSNRGTFALQRIRELVAFLPVLPLPSAAGDCYGKIRAELEMKGEMIGNNDLWIAAHAIASGLILITNDEAEFGRIRGLKIQNWTV